jgi:hypothetical protein
MNISQQQRQQLVEQLFHKLRIKETLRHGHVFGFRLLSLEAKRSKHKREKKPGRATSGLYEIRQLAGLN